jgi:2-oxoglutarate dehydrogenase E2 component (dihydrolipoamide succinyltransferase)
MSTDGRVELRLPSRDGDQEYATVQTWLKKVGDSVHAGEPVVEVDTDKVTEEVVSPTAGTLVDIVALEGDEIKVDGVLAIIEVSRP